MITIDLDAKIKKKIKNLEHKIQSDKVIIKQRQIILKKREERLEALNKLIWGDKKWHV